MMMVLIMQTPIGRLELTASAAGLTGVHLVDDDAAVFDASRDERAAAHIAAATHALQRYFDGDDDAFAHLTLAPKGTPFQQRVWMGLRAIPHGTTMSYAELATRIGHAQAVRAVGLANGRNPLPIVVPCHRVIGANGTLTGFGLGVDVKAWLLVHEGAVLPFGGSVTAASRVRHTTTP
jgi:methylated-DNA-[protein]-cysteine S-methyltransferase